MATSEYTPSNDRHERFVSLFSASHSKLMGYLLSLLGRWHDAEDVLQRASVLMWQKFDSFEVGTDFVAWASTIAFYEARNFQRLAARSPCLFDDDLLATLGEERLRTLPDQDRRLAALEVCLQRLAMEDRSLVQAAYGNEGAIKDLARRLQRAPQTLYNRLNAIRQSLSECVRRKLAEEAA